jgi:hypothetical protein
MHIKTRRTVIKVGMVEFVERLFSETLVGPDVESEIGLWPKRFDSDSSKKVIARTSSGPFVECITMRPGTERV